MTNRNLPLIGVVACNRIIGLHPYNVVGEKYLLAIIKGAGGWPLMLPSLDEPAPLEQLLSCLDGVLLTGSASNIEPHHYQGAASEKGSMHDPKRDAISLPLIRTAIDLSIPLFGICRGFQEMNVALGGSLYQKITEVPGLNNHQEDEADALEIQYGPSHSVRLEPNGVIHRMWGQDTAEVNSLHMQGVERLGDGLKAEAYAPDGLIEAFSVTDSREFALGVQWHPEWKVVDNPFYRSIFQAFGDACRQRAKQRMA